MASKLEIFDPRTIRFGRAWLLGGLLLAAGCGSQSPGRQPVSGRVTLDGTPLDQAVIVFVAVSAPDGAHGKSGSEIRGGEYRLADADGLVPGVYRVEISQYVGPQFAAHGLRSGAVADPPPAAMPSNIPPSYNAHSKLRAEVRAGASNRFDFDLRSSER